MAIAKHGRQQIREAIAAALDNLPTTGRNVFTGRPWALDKKERPGLVVIAPSETIDEEFSTFGAGSKLGRRVTVVIVGYADGEAIDDTLDDIAREVEAAMAADPTFGGRAKDSEIASSEINVDAAGTERVGEIRLTYQALYRTTREAPQTIIS